MCKISLFSFCLLSFHSVFWSKLCPHCYVLRIIYVFYNSTLSQINFTNIFSQLVASPNHVFGRAGILILMKPSLSNLSFTDPVFGLVWKPTNKSKINYIFVVLLSSKILTGFVFAFTSVTHSVYFCEGWEGFIYIHSQEPQLYLTKTPTVSIRRPLLNCWLWLSRRLLKHYRLLLLPLVVLQKWKMSVYWWKYHALQKQDLEDLI